MTAPRVDETTGVRWYYGEDLGVSIWGPTYRDRTNEGLDDSGNRCVLCGRRVADTKKTMGVICIGGGGAIVHVDDADKEHDADPGGFMGWFPIGSECIKAIPVEYRAPNPYPLRKESQ